MYSTVGLFLFIMEEYVKGEDTAEVVRCTQCETQQIIMIQHVFDVHVIKIGTTCTVLCKCM